jgi:hypothetical protein
MPTRASSATGSNPKAMDTPSPRSVYEKLGLCLLMSYPKKKKSFLFGPANKTTYQYPAASTH